MSNKMMQITLVEPESLVLEQVDKPVPGKSELLLKVLRCGVCGSDVSIYHGRHPYAKSPLVMGHEFAGIVEELGRETIGPPPGTRVTVIPHLVCGRCEPCRRRTYNFCEELRCMGAEADGAHAEYICVPAEMALPIEDSMSIDDAAMIEPACVAYHAAKRGQMEPDDKVLIIGAGPIGIFAMQSCKALGAKKVYIADVDQWRLDLAAQLGADGTVNCQDANIETGLAHIGTDSKGINVFYDCVGRQGNVLDDIIQVAGRGARVVVVGVLERQYDIPHLPDFVQHELRLSGTTMYVPQDYVEMIQLIATGKISTQGMITHRFELVEVEKVFKMIEEGTEQYFKIMLEVAQQSD